MGFHHEVFPTDIGYGTVGGPGLNTGGIETSSGAGVYIARWAGARHTYDVAYGVRSYADLLVIKEFFLARNGRTNGFLFIDPHDSNTSSTPYTGDGGPGGTASTDVVQFTANGGETTFQLIKRYTHGGNTFVRTIQKPQSGTLSISLDDSTVADANVSVDTTTGIVTLSGAGIPTAGQVVKAGFSFYTPVRFSESADLALRVALNDYSTSGIENPIELVEDISTVSHSDDYDYGGGSTQAFTGQLSLSPAMGRTVTLKPTAAATVYMPDPTNYPLGGPWFYLFNNSAYTITFKDQDGTTLWSLATTEVGIVCLFDNSGNTWMCAISN